MSSVTRVWGSRGLAPGGGPSPFSASCFLSSHSTTCRLWACSTTASTLCCQGLTRSLFSNGVLSSPLGMSSSTQSVKGWLKSSAGSSSIQLRRGKAAEKPASRTANSVLC